jgi:hypothetical protein
VSLKAEAKAHVDAYWAAQDDTTAQVVRGRIAQAENEVTA